MSTHTLTDVISDIGAAAMGIQGRHCVACNKPGGTPMNIYDGNAFLGRVYVHIDCLHRAKQHPKGGRMKKINAAAVENFKTNAARIAERNKP